MKNELKLLSMSEIQTEKVKWLWHPYIPLVKVTIVQGDTGERNTTRILAIIAALTKGKTLPESDEVPETMNVICQITEDYLADTIKPRLAATGADCARVPVIDESKQELTLCAGIGKVHTKPMQIRSSSGPKGSIRIDDVECRCPCCLRLYFINYNTASHRGFRE